MDLYNNVDTWEIDEHEGNISYNDTDQKGVNKVIYGDGIEYDNSLEDNTKDNDTDLNISISFTTTISSVGSLNTAFLGGRFYERNQSLKERKT